MIFGLLGMFRVSGSRWGIWICAVLLILSNWTGNGFTAALWAADLMIANVIVSLADYAIIPTFLVLCLLREPIKGYFTSR